MRIDLGQVEESAKELYIRALKLLPPDIKSGFDALANQLGIGEGSLHQALAKRLGAMVRDGQLLLNRADEALYLAKSAGRDRIEVAD